MILQYTQLSFPGSSRDKFRIPGFFKTKIEIQGFPGFSGGVPCTNPDMHVEKNLRTFQAPLKV